MANAILNVNAIRRLQDKLIENMLTYGMSMTVIKPKDMIQDPVFHWYTGHDPYNSADNECFMARVARQQEKTNG